jgi:hypothetical protein
MRKAIVGSSDVGASSTACLNAAISSCVAGRGLSVVSSAQIGIPSEVSALRSDLRSAWRQISLASARPIASKTSAGLPLISRVKICGDRGSSGCRDGSRTDMNLLLKRKAMPANDQDFPDGGICQINNSGGRHLPLRLQPPISTRRRMVSDRRGGNSGWAGAKRPSLLRARGGQPRSGGSST